MKFTLVVLVAGLLATPGTSIPDESTIIIQDVVSCKKFDDRLKETTNNRCSLHALGKIKACESALSSLPKKTLVELAIRSEKCNEDLAQKVKEIIEDRILESVTSSLEKDDNKEMQQPVYNKKKSSKAAKKNIAETKGSYQRRDM